MSERAARVIGGRFRLEREVGAGGMGTVYRALDEGSGRPVALKLLRGVADAQRFAREARALAALDEDTVVRYVGHGLAGEGEAFLAMEWLEGRDLAAHLDARVLSPGETVTLGRRLCEGLAAIHRAGLLHRDLKPANVMLVGGECARAKIVDLGLARRQQGASRVTRTGAILGTVGYMSPEQARGMRALRASTDLFSLGCVLHECLTGVPAFEGANVAAVLAKVLIGEPAPLRAMRPDVPAALAELIERLLDKDPSARATDAAQVGRWLATLSFEDGAGSAAAPPAVLRHRVGIGERRVVNALLIAPPLASPEGDTAVAEPLEPRSEGVAQDIATIVAQYGGRATALAGEMVVVGFDDVGSAAERTSRAALSALAIVEGDARRRGAHRRGAQHRGAPHRVALAVGRSDVTGEAELGDALDRAASLIDQAEPGAIAIDQASARLLGGRFDVAEVEGGLRLRGRTLRGQTPHDATRNDQGESGERAGGRLLGKVVPFVGRRKELAFLRAAHEEVLEERAPQVVIVNAPAGAGKSRLAAELRATIGAPVAVLYAATTPLSMESAGALARSLLRSALDAEHPSFEQLLAYVRQLPLEEPESVAEFLGELLGRSTDSPKPRLLAARRDALVMANRVSSAFADWLRAEAQARPLALILEDTHWADAVSLGYIDLALRSDPAILVLALTRPEGVDALEEMFERFEPDTLELKPLSSRAGATIARVALAQADDAVVEDIVRRAGGNPFFLEELVRAIAAGQEEIPDTVIALTEDRIGRLEPELRQVLRAASVFGPSSWVAGVAQVAGLPVAAALESMDRLVEAELLRRRAGSRLQEQLEYGFVHALPREAAYGMIPERERAGAHGLAAHWLEFAGETDAAMLAEHYTLAADRDRALTWRVAATKGAVAAGNYLAVCRHIARAASLEPEGGAKTELLVCEARSAVYAGAYRSAMRASTGAMMRLSARNDAWMSMVGCLAWAAARTGDKVAFAAAGLALGDPRTLEGATADHAFALLVLHMASVMSLGLEAGRPFLEALREVTARAGPDDLRVQGWGRFSEALMGWYEDDPTAPLAFLKARDLLERSGDLMAFVATLSMSAFGELTLGRYDALRAITRRAKQLGEERGLWSAFPVALCIQCFSDSDVDDERAEALLAEAETFGERDHVFRWIVHAVRLFRSLVRGDWEVCRALSRTLEGSPLIHARVWGGIAEAWSVFELGDRQRAVELEGRARERVESTGCLPVYRTVLDDLSLRLRVESGERAAALRLARESLARHEGYARSLGEEERHLYWARAPWVSRARARIDEVLAGAPTAAS